MNGRLLKDENNNLEFELSVQPISRIGLLEKISFTSKVMGHVRPAPTKDFLGEAEEIRYELEDLASSQV
jgi:hypothetical protein